MTYPNGATRFNGCEEQLCNRGRWVSTGLLSDPQCECLGGGLACMGTDMQLYHSGHALFLLYFFFPIFFQEGIKTFFEIKVIILSTPYFVA